MTNWKPVQGYENLYEVSEFGDIRSLCGRYGKNRLLKQGVGSKGYFLVTLCDKGKQKTVNVHRLVATAFIPNPESLPCVNHKDENKKNNHVSNLEWCSYYQNNIYGQRLTKSALKCSKPVRCVETGIIYPSSCQAMRDTGIRQSGITSCCLGKRKTAGKLHWEYA